MNSADELYRCALLQQPFLEERTKSYKEYAPFLLLIYGNNGRSYFYDRLTDSVFTVPSDDTALDKRQTCMIFGYLLRRQMYRRGFTQETLAKASGLQQCQICNYTYGRSCPSYYAFDKLVRALGCSAEDLRYVK